MKHFLCNVTFRCQNAGVCRYCWVEGSVRKRGDTFAERPPEDWIRAIQRERPDTVDLAGGEPTLYEGLGEIIRACPRVSFGLSTNALDEGAIAALAEARLPNLVSINCSFHPDRLEADGFYGGLWLRNVKRLREAGYRVHVNVVDYEGQGVLAPLVADMVNRYGVQVVVSPYEDVARVVETDVPLVCLGGINHLNVAPDGTAWPCLSTMRSENAWALELGNWLDGTLDLGRRIQPCYLYCADYYILPRLHLGGDVWNVQARPA
jgi:hypothetical protein